jgi:hypothetical protein
MQAASARPRTSSPYYTDDLGPLPPLLQRVTKRAMASGDIVIRPLDKKNIKRDIAIVMDIFNDAWSHNWGFVPFTSAELEKLANDMKMLVHGEYVAIVSYKGERRRHVCDAAQPQ